MARRGDGRTGGPGAGTPGEDFVEFSLDLACEQAIV